MKKILVLCGLLSLNACVYAGDVNVWGKRGEWVESFQTYSIDFWMGKPRIVKTIPINEKSFDTGEIRTAFKGYSVLSDKTFDRTYFTSEKAKANMNGVLSSASAPYRFKKNQLVEVVGSSVADGVEYRLLQTDLPNFVLLANNDGVVKHGGQIRNNRLVVMPTVLVPSNPDFRLAPVMITSTTQTRPNKGFDIKYDGIRLNRMWFTYFDYATDVAGGFREYSFPKKPGLLTIGSARIRVLEADEQRIDYMVIDN